MFGGNMIWIVIGMFVLTWIVSAVMKASQTPRGRSNSATNRDPERPAAANPRTVERTTNNDLARFMEEIDRLRTRGDAGAGSTAVSSRPAERSRSTSDSGRPTGGSSRPRPNQQRRSSASGPPPVPQSPASSLPVLRPISTLPPAPPPPPPPVAPPQPPTPTAVPISSTAIPTATSAASVPTAPKIVQQAKGVAMAAASPVIKGLEAILRTKRGPAMAVALSEIFGERKGARSVRRG